MLDGRKEKMNPSSAITWNKFPDNPLRSLAAEPGTWRADASMTVNIIQRGDQYQIFYTGKRDGIDSIGIASCPQESFNGALWKDYHDNPVLSPGKPGSFDSRHLVDPAATEWEGKIYLYYSALGDGPDSIGLAISEDGWKFSKLEKPVLVGRAPEIVKVGNILYMLYSMDSKKGGYEFHLATSSDGKSFYEEGSVFTPAVDGWDSLSVVTPRVFFEEDIFIMAYAGDDKEKDFPTKFGLAFSKDMRSWERYPGNPVFTGGLEGTWESRAIWYPEILKRDKSYYMWYEGHDGKRSQVGLAISESPISETGRSILGLK
jgi:predicted GH43/DUF377 family glycosyl hydrolase